MVGNLMRRQVLPGQWRGRFALSRTALVNAMPEHLAPRSLQLPRWSPELRAALETAMKEHMFGLLFRPGGRTRLVDFEPSPRGFRSHLGGHVRWQVVPGRYEDLRLAWEGGCNGASAKCKQDPVCYAVQTVLQSVHLIPRLSEVRDTGMFKRAETARRACEEIFRPATQEIPAKKGPIEA